MRTTRAMNATRLRQSTKGRLRKKKLCYNCTGSNNLSTVATATVQDDINVIIYIYICIYIYIYIYGKKSRSLYMLEDAKETIHPTVVAFENK